ncbi:GlcG/HbpS family heme-binding protein [Nesterenkonia natronophila]|uniref:Heme-binding protein n=1 Tax=Nesterenkonia natronophila TaxID=2174932 RepID=A0A3A4F363_9MICC|nr:heme-binding protein [Nesterenkonia natronophila]RJN32181.1 heme-binding protein [Nesterenkonia natronophila]
MADYTTIPAVTYTTAAEAVRHTIEIGAERGLKLCATVVDPALGLVAYGRADGMTPHSVETSRRKAQTAASTRKPSAAVPAELATAMENGTGGLLTRIPGGVPLMFDGVVVGGLGVAGGPPAEDAKVADAVLEALGAAPVGGAA